jgi:hypothetical protein
MLVSAVPVVIQGQSTPTQSHDGPQPARDARPQARTGAAAIRGRIVAADTRHPLIRARITLAAPELGPDGRSTSTNADGRYEINDLPAARYSLSVSRSGYLPVRYGQRRPLEQGSLVQVSEAEVVEDVDFSLPKPGAIAGRVTDDTGEPMAGARVMAMRSTFFEGRRQLVPTGANGGTDDSGRYRIEGLVPGSYYLLAVVRDTWTYTEDRVDHVIAYAPTFFPGTPSVGEAARISLGIGASVENADFSLASGRAASVSGTAADSHGRPLGGETVYPTVEFRGPSGNEVVAVEGATPVAPDGTFTVRNLPPGDYKLNMHVNETEADGRSRIEDGATSIVLNGANLEHVAITTSIGWSVTGRVTTETGDPPDIDPDRVRVLGAPLTGAFEPRKAGGNPDSGRVKRDWTFAVTRLFGPVRLRVDLPAGWMLKAVRLDGRDIIDMPLAPKGGDTVADVEVVITNRVTTVLGRIVDEGGAPVTDGSLIVFPDDPARWGERSGYVRTARPDQQGDCVVKGLPPGEYLAVAVDYVPEGQWNDPEYLESLRRDAQKLTLDDGGTQAVSLKRLSREPAFVVR